MAYPRMIFPGKTYMITRRTVLRHFLFRPDDETNELIEYALAVSAKLYGMSVHAFCAMSTHIHVVLTDTHGRLPFFLAYFHRLVAMGTKILRHWEGSIWDSEQTSVVELLTRDAIVDKIAYVLANPVAAGAVRNPEEWPGAKTRVDDIGQTVLNTRRPKVYFAAKIWPESSALPIQLPPIVAEMEAEAFREDVAMALAAEVATVGKTIAMENELGIKEVTTIAPETRAKTVEPPCKRNPTFAAGRGHGDIAAMAVRAVRAFRAAYRAALDKWCAGDRNATFPEGTWWMRVHHAVSIGGCS